MKQAIFLDRDGVINEAIIINNRPFSPVSEEEVKILEHVKESIEKLFANNFEIIVVTNQPDLTTGKTTIDFVNSVHNLLQQELDIKHFYICPHVESDNCICRKPKPGLIFQAAKEHDVDLQASFLVGDRWKDIQAGQSAGCASFFIDNKYDEPMPKHPYVAVKSLHDAVNIILENQKC
jgi:D-glycero-D-manno-heptose 1,7-bisphosphate phosphatase